MLQQRLLTIYPESFDVDLVEIDIVEELLIEVPDTSNSDREVYLNVLNNIGSPIVAKIAVDDEIARALAHEDMDTVEFRNRVRALPRGEWIAQVPSPEFGETGPMPFSVGPLPFPDGHPESNMAPTTDVERRFSEVVDRVHERTKAEYSVPVDVSQPTVRVPDSLQNLLELASDGLDELLAVLTRYVQLQRGVDESNGWVPVRAVDDLLETWYETDLPTSDSDDTKDHREVPSREILANIRDRSPLFELTIDTDREETTIRLTESGERSIELETDEVQAAGGKGHDQALATVEEAFTRAGYLVAPVQQDGSEQPDAWAVHPDTDSILALEDHVEYVHTTGMTESDVDDQLHSGEHGGLGLADESDAYAIPLSYHYGGERFLLRVSQNDGDSEKSSSSRRLRLPHSCATRRRPASRGGFMFVVRCGDGGRMLKRRPLMNGFNRSVYLAKTSRASNSPCIAWVWRQLLVGRQSISGVLNIGARRYITPVSSTSSTR